MYYTQCTAGKVIPERGLMTQMTFSGNYLAWYRKRWKWCIH